MSFWKNKKVNVTGGAGFIGSHLVEMLVNYGSSVTVLDNFENGISENLRPVANRIKTVTKDLRSLDECLQATKDADIVMNLAAKVAGIEYNRQNPSEMFFDNIRISSNILEACRINKTERLLIVSSACVYPRDCIIPTPESEGYRYVPEPTNEGYGWAKRIAESQAMAYAGEYNMKIAIARPYNAYGPRDHFNPEKSHVIAALINKIFSGQDPLVVWGNGEQSRAFLYVEDFARGLLDVTEKYPAADPINIGSDEEIKIRDLVNLILKISEKSPKVLYDTSKPAGQPRRNCDNRKAMKKVGYKSKISLAEGLAKTIEWYKSNILKNEH